MEATKTLPQSLPMSLGFSGAVICRKARGIALIDFVNVDSMVQVHGNTPAFPAFLSQLPHAVSIDYEGVGLGSRDANSKAAAGQASKIFQDYYPEFLVCILDSPYRYPISSLPYVVQEVLHQRPNLHDLGILVVQASYLRQHVGEDERCWQWHRYDQ
jgi:hypothetical protein